MLLRFCLIIVLLQVEESWTEEMQGKPLRAEAKEILSLLSNFATAKAPISLRENYVHMKDSLSELKTAQSTFADDQEMATVLERLGKDLMTTMVSWSHLNRDDNPDITLEIGTKVSSLLVMRINQIKSMIKTRMETQSYTEEVREDVLRFFNYYCTEIYQMLRKTIHDVKSPAPPGPKYEEGIKRALDSLTYLIQTYSPDVYVMHQYYNELLEDVENTLKNTGPRVPWKRMLRRRHMIQYYFEECLKHIEGFTPEIIESVVGELLNLIDIVHENTALKYLASIVWDQDLKLINV